MEGGSSDLDIFWSTPRRDGSVLLTGSTLPALARQHYQAAHLLQLSSSPRPHKKDHSVIPSSLPAFPPPARYTLLALFSCSSSLSPSSQTSGSNNWQQSQSNSEFPAFPMHLKGKKRRKANSGSALLQKAGLWYVPQCQSLLGPPSETPHQTLQETWGADFLETGAWKGG